MSDIKHGSVFSYRRKGCRCEPCCDAYRRDKNAYYARRKARDAAGIPPNPPGRARIPLDQRPHGDYVTYSKGCRCEACTSANSEYGRRRRDIRQQEEWERNGRWLKLTAFVLLSDNPIPTYEALVKALFDAGFTVVDSLDLRRFVGHAGQSDRCLS